MPVRTKSKPEVFAEEIEYTNITEFREKLLRTVDELQKSPARRYLVTKHGKPQAVLMSYNAYQVFRKLAEEVMAAEARKDSETALRDAIRRMDEDYGVSTPGASPVRIYAEALSQLANQPAASITPACATSEEPSEPSPAGLRFEGIIRSSRVRFGIQKLRRDLDRLERLVEEEQEESSSGLAHSE